MGKIRFREFSRYFFRLYLPLAILLLGISISFYLTSNMSRRSAFRAQESINIQQQEEIIRHQIQDIISDLAVLSENHFLQNLFVNDNDANRRLIEDAFLVFARNKKKYDQLRVIGANGMELVRVNWNYGKPNIVPRQQLQDKSRRYYFLDTMGLSRGEVFVSPLDLNIEHGKLEEPRKPMIRFASPIFNKDREKTGMVILNFLGAHLLEDLAKLGDASAGNVLMLNQDGFYLRGANAADEWGFMFQGKEEKSFSHRYPVAWKEISTQETGQFVTSNGLFSFTTVHPLFEGLQSSTGSPEAYARSAERLSARDYVWKLVSHVQPSVMNAHQYPYLVPYIGGNLLLLIILGIGCWMAADAGCRRKNAESELKSEREKFRTVADFTYDWEYWVGPDGRYVYTSPSSERITGYSAQDFRDDPGLLLKLVHHDDLPKMIKHLNIEYTESEKDVCHIDFRITAATGEERWIAHVCQAVFGEDGRFLGRRASNSDISLRKQIELELEELATHDILTNLPNRKLLYDRLSQILAQAKRGELGVAILFVDLDKFKEINDGLGHEAGDIVLKQAARRMEGVLRQGDTLARMGGDEFVVVLPDVKDDAVVDIVAQKLIGVIGQTFQIDDRGETVNRHLGASIGISIYPADGQDIDSLINAADRAMYQAKNMGRNQYVRSSSVCSQDRRAQ